MKKTMKKLAVGAALVASLALGTALQAAPFGSLRSFNTTNYLLGGTTSLANWPTNSINTNGSPTSTGGPIDVSGFGHYGIVVSGFLSSTNTNGVAIGVQLITSMASGSPVVTFGTNVLSPTVITNLYNDWSYEASGIVNPNTALNFTWTFPTNAAGSGISNWFNFQTNIAETTVAGDANWLGVYQITNNLSGAGSYITNFGVYVNTKLKPFVLIGN